MGRAWLRIIYVTIGCFTGGYVVGLGFVAAQSKFKAVSVSHTGLLEVGKHQFVALHVGEWALITLILIFGLAQPSKVVKALSATVYALFMVQMFAVYPTMSDRLARQLKGEELPPSAAHGQYVMLVGAMMVLLLTSVILAQLPPKRTE